MSSKAFWVLMPQQQGPHTGRRGSGRNPRHAKDAQRNDSVWNRLWDLSMTFASFDDTRDSDAYAFFNLLTGEHWLDTVESLLPAHRERQNI